MLIVIICIYIFHCQPWPIFNCCSFHFLHSTARTKSGRSTATVADQSNGIRHQAAHQNGQKDKCIQKLLPKWSGGFVEGRLHRNDDLAFDSAIRYRSFDMAYTTITRAYHYRSNGCLEIGQQLCAWRIRIVHTQFRRKTTKGRKRDTDNERYRIVFPQSTDDHTFGCVEIRAGNFRMIVFVVYYWSLLTDILVWLSRIPTIICCADIWKAFIRDAKQNHCTCAWYTKSTSSNNWKKLLSLFIWTPIPAKWSHCSERFSIWKTIRICYFCNCLL